MHMPEIPKHKRRFHLEQSPKMNLRKISAFGSLASVLLSDNTEFTKNPYFRPQQSKAKAFSVRDILHNRTRSLRATPHEKLQTIFS